MRTRLQLPLAFLGWLLLASSMVAEEGNDDSSAGGHRRLRFAFVTCFVDQKYFDPLKKGMRDASQMMGVECDFIGTTGLDVAEQADMVRRAVADGVDGIALNLIDPEAFDKIVAETTAKGIPVVAFNVDDSSSPNARLASVNQRVYDAGRKVAERASSHIPNGTHVLMTKHDEGVSALDDRLRGVQDGLKSKNVTYTTIVTGNDAIHGSEVIAEALRHNSDIHIVLCSGQSDTEAAGRAIEGHFANKGYWAAGFDLSPKTLELIQKGHIRFTVDQQPYVQGFYPVVALTLNLRYGLAPSDMDSGAGIVDRSNVQEIIYLTAKGYR